MLPLIDAPRQSNFRLRASFFVAIITTAATPNSHPDCRALLIKIVALHHFNRRCARHKKPGLPVARVRGERRRRRHDVAMKRAVRELGRMQRSPWLD
jgi:hypothetical protein